MKHFFSIIICFAAVSLSAQEEVIPWSSVKKLTWQDFKGTPKANSSAAAITASGISYEFSATMQGDKVYVDYKVNSYFYPQNSWYNRSLADISVLRHEQLHFDITELHARKMRKILSAMKFTTKVRKQIKRVYNEVISDLQKMQRQYDTESDYSRNPEGQLKWETRIASELKKYHL
jgi:hypothetical protein